MSSRQVRSNDATASASVSSVDMKHEKSSAPARDVDRAKEFYSRLGWRLDADRTAGNNVRLFQFTPPGSGRSVQFGRSSSWPWWLSRRFECRAVLERHNALALQFRISQVSRHTSQPSFHS